MRFNGRKHLLAGAALCLLALAACGRAPAPETAESAQSVHRTAAPASPSSLHGVTVTTPNRSDATIRAVSSLDPEPTVRIVFDLDTDLEEYRDLIEGLDPHARLMAQIVDSTDLAELTVDQMRRRTRALFNAFGDRVDIWEIGNELNAEWAGSGPDDINEKTAAAAEIVNESNGKTAITLNYWSSSNCYAQSWEQTLPYARTLPADVLSDLDYFLLSVYETACEPAQHPSAADLSEALIEFGRLAPGADLGIGEIGVQGVEDGFEAASPSDKEEIARRYMGMSPELHRRVGDRFVDGWFWWYFVEDAVRVDEDESLLPVLDELLSAMP